MFEEIIARLNDLGGRVGALEVQESGGVAVDLTDLERRRDAWMVVAEHFDVADEVGDRAWVDDGDFWEPGWFALGNSLLSVPADTGGARYFLAATEPVAGGVVLAAALAFVLATVDLAAGVRLDDGSDDNYAELVLRVDTVLPQSWVPELRYRTGGGAVTTVSGTAFHTPELAILCLSTVGSLTGSPAWSVTADLRLTGSPGAMRVANTGTGGFTWTPTRWGLIVDNGAGTTGTVRVDFVNP